MVNSTGNMSAKLIIRVIYEPILPEGNSKSFLISRPVRRAVEIERQAANALAPVHVPAPETGITSTTSIGPNTGKRDATKATATRTGAEAAHPRSPRTKRGIDTDERKLTSLCGRAAPELFSMNKYYIEIFTCLATGFLFKKNLTLTFRNNSGLYQVFVPLS